MANVTLLAGRRAASARHRVNINRNRAHIQIMTCELLCLMLV